MDYQNDFENYQEVKKESFFKKHGFAFGVIFTLALVFLTGAGITSLLRATGQILILGETGASTISGHALLDDKTVDKLDEIYNAINIYYYGDFEKDELEGAMYKGLVEGLNDPYSVYYTKEEYEDMMVSTTGTYYGIGAGLSQNVDTMIVTITKVYRGTPAEEAGLKNGDIIVSVEDLDATSMEVSELVQHIRGEAGTKVHMTIYRESTGETLEFEVERRNVELPSIEGEMLEGEIGYIQISEFQSKTDEQFMEMYQSLTEAGMKGLIVDVRANPGGLLSSVVNICDFILPEGLIVYVEDCFGNVDEYFSKNSSVDMPIVLLVDENSASASEILAGALKDYEYATLVGKTTFGKGIVQNIFPLSDDDAVKLTTGKYFTPKGNYIHGEGIAPDVEVEYEYTGPETESYDKQYDSQFVEAVKIIKGMMQ